MQLRGVIGQTDTFIAKLDSFRKFTASPHRLALIDEALAWKPVPLGDDTKLSIMRKSACAVLKLSIAVLYLSEIPSRLEVTRYHKIMAAMDRFEAEGDFKTCCILTGRISSELRI